MDEDGELANEIGDLGVKNVNRLWLVLAEQQLFM